MLVRSGALIAHICALSAENLQLYRPAFGEQLKTGIPDLAGSEAALEHDLTMLFNK
jgi:hypothetical protein